MSTPQMRTPGGNRASAGHEAADPAIVGQADIARKRLAHMRATAALAGLRVHALDADGGFVIVGPQGWCSRELRDLHALAQALRGMGVAL
jgi:hypothetical protein